MAARLADNFSSSVSKVTLEEYRRAFGGPYIPDSVIDTATDRILDERQKMPTLADIRVFVTEEQMKENRKRQITRQITQDNEPPMIPTIAQKALYQYIYMSAGSKTQVSIAGYEEYALKVFGLDPDQLLNSFGNTVQSTLFGIPLPEGERWPQTGPPLPAKCYVNAWAKDSAIGGIGKSFPNPKQAMTPKEVFAQRKKVESETTTHKER